MDLINSIIQKGPHLNEAMQVAESSFTAILGREAAYTGRRFAWDDLLNSDLDLLPKELTFEAKIPAPPVPIPGTGPGAVAPKKGGRKAAGKAKAGA